MYDQKTYAVVCKAIKTAVKNGELKVHNIRIDSRLGIDLTTYLESYGYVVRTRELSKDVSILDINWTAGHERHVLS